MRLPNVEEAISVVLFVAVITAFNVRRLVIIVIVTFYLAALVITALIDTVHHELAALLTDVGIDALNIRHIRSDRSQIEKARILIHAVIVPG